MPHDHNFNFNLCLTLQKWLILHTIFVTIPCMIMLIMSVYYYWLLIWFSYNVFFLAFSTCGDKLSTLFDCQNMDILVDFYLYQIVHTLYGCSHGYL